MNRTPMIATRKRRLVTAEQTATSAVNAQEASSYASSLQAIMSKIQQLREEQRCTSRNSRRRCASDAEIQRLQQASDGLVEQQINPSDNFDSFGSMRDRVAHASADDDAAGAIVWFIAKAIKLKHDTYDGSVSLNEFFIQFQLIA